MDEDRLPTGLWVDAHLRRLNNEGQLYYIVNKGAYATGTVLIKVNNTQTGCFVYQQQRNLDGEMGWMTLFRGQAVEEREADEYIRKAVDRDPDLWAIEVEGPTAANPFEGPVF